MRKVINTRYPVIIAIALIVGIFISYALERHGLSLLWIIAIIPVTAIILILQTVFGKNRYRSVLIVIAAIFVASGAINGFIRLDNYKNSEITYGYTYAVEATVKEKYKNNNGEYLILSDVSFNGNKASGNLIAYLAYRYGDFCDVGYKVEFISEINKKDTFAYGKLNNYVQENVKYDCYVFGGLKAEYGFSLFGFIRSAIRDIFYENTDPDTAAIAVAMLTGNTQGVDEGEMNSFRYGGIAHIFAVSGLHIGLLFGVFNLLCKKLKLSKYPSLFICILPIFFYVGVCGFTVSSIRAAIMCAVPLTLRLFYKKHDSLNALAFAVIILLTVIPLSMFSIGFQLSVCAVCSIILLSKRIASPFKRLPDKISGALGVSLSAQAGTMPIMMTNFGYISPAGLLLNIFVLPILSAIFILLFISTVLLLIFGFAAQYLIPITVVPLQAVVSFFLNAGFENAILSGFGGSELLPFYFLLILIISDKINFNALQRAVFAICTIAALCTVIVTQTFLPLSGYKIVTFADRRGGITLFKHNEINIAVLSEDINDYTLNEVLRKNYVKNLNAAIILGGADCINAYTSLKIKCDSVYIYDEYPHLPSYENVYYVNEFDFGGINFSFADGYSVNARIDEINVAVCMGETLPYKYCDLLISDAFDEECGYTHKIGLNDRAEKINVYDLGQIIFKVDEGILKRV